MTLIQFNTAKLAKEKGFNWETTHYFTLDYSTFKSDGKCKQFEAPVTDNTNILQLRSTSKHQPHLAAAPTQSELQKWLREKFEIHIAINPWKNMDHCNEYTVTMFKSAYMPPLCFEENEDCDILEEWENSIYEDSYEKALEKGLYEALKLIKNGNN